MASFLLELFSEEIPARMQLPAVAQMRQLFDTALKENYVKYTDLNIYITPRRLTVIIDDLDQMQHGSESEKRGPRVDANEQAIAGFVKSTGMSIDQLEQRETPKGTFFFAVTKSEDVNTADILTNITNEILPKFTWPKSMRWGLGETKWVRPLHSIIALFDSEILPVEFANIKASNFTYGHRFLSKGEIKVKDAQDYLTKLDKADVVLDHTKRRQMILDNANNITQDKNLKLRNDDALIDEVTGLVEYPNILLGEIDQEFMELPDEVLISSIRTHQKYLCLEDESGKLAPYFILASNMKTNDDAVITHGNERVLRARLSDSIFFWQQDRQNKLESRVAKLDGITFHESLGTIGDKVKRITAQAKFLAIWVPKANLELVERAATLCKTDLVTEMVGEFGELQGLMGKYYAEHDGEDAQVVDAMLSHYQPVGANDDVPTRPVAIAIALADKMDSLAGMFAINQQPTGSKDPFALRRAALGIIRIILENKLNVPMRIALSTAMKNYPANIYAENESAAEPETKAKKIISKIIKTGKLKKDDVVGNLMQFFNDRLIHAMKKDNIRHDLIMSVFGSGNEDDMLEAVARVHTLDKFLQTSDGTDLLAAYRRAANMVTQTEKQTNKTIKGSPNKKDCQGEEENNLFDILTTTQKSLTTTLKNKDYQGAMSLLSDLREPIDAFLEGVVVNVEDEPTKLHRLKLLAQIRETMHEVADFSKIEG